MRGSHECLFDLRMQHITGRVSTVKDGVLRYGSCKMCMHVPPAAHATWLCMRHERASRCGMHGCARAWVAASMCDSPMGSHMRLMEPSLPPWLLNQSVKEMLSRARTDRMPPSGSISALTIGEVPNASELAAYTHAQPCSRASVSLIATGQASATGCKAGSIGPC